MLINNHNISDDRLKSSKLFSSLLQLCKVEDGITIEVQDDVLDDYLNQDGKNLSILESCFNFCHLIEDEIYFAYLMDMFHQNFFIAKKVLNKVNDNLKRDIYLSSPLSLIPQEIITDTFLQSWLGVSGGKYFIIDGISHSSEMTYHDNGSIKELVIYVKQKKCGPQWEWYETGVKKCERWYQDDKLHGYITHYYEDSKLKSKWNYSNDKIHGTCQAWYEDGTLTYRQEFWEGKRDGYSLIWQGENTYAEQQHKDGRLIYDSRAFYE